MNKKKIRRILYAVFAVWTVFSVVWLINSYRTQGVAERLLEDTERVRVESDDQKISLIPLKFPLRSALVFVSGGGVAAEAYVPMLKPLANRGFPVYIMRLPWRISPLSSHRQTVMTRVNELIDNSTDMRSFVLAGHSLGAAIVSEMALRPHEKVTEFVLIGTTHPKRHDLSALTVPITKVLGSEDGVASVEKAENNRSLLPESVTWIVLEGANHSQFGHYGSQLFDGDASITREAQQEQTRDILLDRITAPVRKTDSD